MALLLAWNWGEPDALPVVYEELRRQAHAT
jgi:hypothetical protein